MRKYSAILALALLAACNNGKDDDKTFDPEAVPKAVPAIAYTIVAEYPHDTSAYTQGLQLYNGKMYEGTGDYQASSLRITDYKTGRVEKKHMMGTDKIFGEGITILNNKLYQLTWENKLLYVYDVNNIEKPIATLNWPYDGWGITSNGTDLIISDGTAKLYFVDPATLKVKSTIAVTENGDPVPYINELEYVDGFVFANKYEAETIYKIDPSSGFVVGKMDMTGLKQKYFPGQNITGRTDVLNGIAYDSATKKFFITGKRWPKMFELQLN